jgi:hypothetical protein
MDREALQKEAAEKALLEEADRRRPLYKDVEDLITPGFLTHTLVVDGVSIVFRSLDGSRTIPMLHRLDAAQGLDWKRWYIATSVWMIDGFLVDGTPRGNDAYYVFHTWAKNLRYEWVEALFPIIVGIRNRVGRALKIVEAYACEKFSRSLWHTKPSLNTEPTLIQRLWVAHNSGQDDFEAENTKWSHTTSIVGSMSGKGAKSLRQSTEKWEQRREDRRRRVIEDAVNWIIQGERSEQAPIFLKVGGIEYEVPKIHASQTVDEMQEELMRAMRGEKDYHDMVMDAHKAQRLAAKREREQKRKAALRDALADRMQAGLSGETALVGYTADQLRELNPGALQNRTTRADPAAPQDSDSDRYLMPEIRPGWIGLQGTPEAADPVAPENPPGDGGDTGGGSLQDKISRRKPTLKP